MLITKRAKQVPQVSSELLVFGLRVELLWLWVFCCFLLNLSQHLLLELNSCRSRWCRVRFRFIGFYTQRRSISITGLNFARGRFDIVFWVRFCTMGRVLFRFIGWISVGRWRWREVVGEVVGDVCRLNNLGNWVINHMGFHIWDSNNLGKLQIWSLWFTKKVK